MTGLIITLFKGDRTIDIPRSSQERDQADMTFSAGISTAQLRMMISQVSVPERKCSAADGLQYAVYSSWLFIIIVAALVRFV
jgi:hypothetical protein